MSTVHSTVETSGFSPRVPSNCTAGKKFCQSYNSSLKLDTLPVSLMKCDELSLFVPVQKLFSGLFSRSLILGVIKLDWCNFVWDGKSTGNLPNTYTVKISWHIPIPPHSCDKFALHFLEFLVWRPVCIIQKKVRPLSFGSPRARQRYPTQRNLHREFIASK